MKNIIFEDETLRKFRENSGHLRVEYKTKCKLCGEIVYTTAKGIRTGKTKMCVSCYRENNSQKRDYQKCSFDVVYNLYVRSSQNRKLEWDISKYEFLVLTKQNCYYCGKECSSGSKKKHTYNGLYYYNGLDRIDSTKGYTLDNVVPCCKECNFAKRNSPIKYFLEMIERIHLFQESEGIMKKILDRQVGDVL